VTFLNNPKQGNLVRYPRARVMLNGNTQMPFPISFDVKTTNNLTADTFDLVFSLYGDPNFDTNWWQTQASFPVDIQVGFKQEDDDENSVSYTSLVSGVIDGFLLDTWTGKVTCHGRDQSSYFIDTKIIMDFQNQTSSQIVQILAAGHGMQADCDATNTPVGRYYQQDHTNTNSGEFSKGKTEWDFLCYLARQENFDLYVTGNTIHFKQAVNETNQSGSIWCVTAPIMKSLGNGVSSWINSTNHNELRIERSLTLAKDIKVIVQSWHSKNGRSYQAIAERKQGGTKGGSESVQTFVFNMHNITQAQAQAQANSLLSDISKHEVKISWHEPGDINLNARCLVALIDSDSAFDQTYYIDTIHFQFSATAGFTMDVNAKNHQTQSQATG
jgi:phage protein D